MSQRTQIIQERLRTLILQSYITLQKVTVYLSVARSQMSLRSSRSNVAGFRNNARTHCRRRGLCFPAGCARVRRLRSLWSRTAGFWDLWSSSSVIPCRSAAPKRQDGVCAAEEGGGDAQASEERPGPVLPVWVQRGKHKVRLQQCLRAPNLSGLIPSQQKKGRIAGTDVSFPSYL